MMQSPGCDVSPTGQMGLRRRSSVKNPSARRLQEPMAVFWQ